MIAASARKSLGSIVPADRREDINHASSMRSADRPLTRAGASGLSISNESGGEAVLGDRLVSVICSCHLTELYSVLITVSKLSMGEVEGEREEILQSVNYSNVTTSFKGGILDKCS